MFLVLAAAALAASPAQAAPEQPGRDPELLHRAQVAAEKDAEQEQTLRRLLALGGAPIEQAEVLARLAGVLRARGFALAVRAQAAADEGDANAAAQERSRSADARAEAIARYRELLKKYPDAPRTDEALFFLADTLQETGREQEAVAAARELTRRFPRSQYAPASHVFIGEHLFDKAKLDDALREYRAAAQVPGDEVYAYALYKAAWCRFNQGGFSDSMKLLHKVVAVSLGGDAQNARKGADVNRVQLAREARRDFVLAYGRIGKPEAARDEFDRLFGREAGRRMLEQYGKLLFDQARDPEAILVHHQLLEMHGDTAAAALDQTRLLVIAQRSGKRRELLREADALVVTFRRVHLAADEGAVESERMEEARRLAEETLRTLAIQIHNEARKTELDETWAAGKALYANYLALFPDSPDAYELRYFDAELLYTRGDKAAAATQYETVVRQDLAAIGAGKKPGRWLQKAAWSGVVSRAEVIEKSGHEERGKVSQRGLTADEELLAKSCLLYLQALPEGPKAVEVAFKLGRLEYVSGQLDAAEKHLSWVATAHPEHMLAEYAANLVLDVSNLRKDWPGVHAWALRFLADPRLLAHGNLAQDLRRIEEESAYAIADAVSPDPAKAEALLGFVAAHPKGQLADKALFGAAAAYSRVGRVDEALAARERIWKEKPASRLVARALLASASDHATVGDFGESAALLERYAQGFRSERALRKRPRAPSASSAGSNGRVEAPSYDEQQAQAALHDAAVLREARGELRQALADRQLSLQLWQNPPDRLEAQRAIALLRSRIGESARPARELAAIARAARGDPALQIGSWREAARLFARAGETDHAQWSWVELERIYKSLAPAARQTLPADAVTAVAEAHLALGEATFDAFRRQQIKPPLMATLNRKIALLQTVKKRVEETVAMRQAEPAVCALARLGEAQMLLGEAIHQSPVPPGLNAEQRKIYRDALTEKAQPLYAEARETLRGADEKAHELGVTGACPARAAGLLEKLGGKAASREAFDVPRGMLSPVPEYVDADGAPLAQVEEGGR